MVEATTTEVMRSMVSLLAIKNAINMEGIHAHNHDCINWSRGVDAIYKSNYPSGEAALPSKLYSSSRLMYFPQN